MSSDVSQAFFWFASSILLYPPSHHCRCSLVVTCCVVLSSSLCPVPVASSWPGPCHPCCIILFPFSLCWPGPGPPHPCCPRCVILSWSWSLSSPLCHPVLFLLSSLHCPVLVLVIPIVLSWSSCRCLLLSPSLPSWALVVVVVVAIIAVATAEPVVVGVVDVVVVDISNFNMCHVMCWGWAKMTDKYTITVQMKNPHFWDGKKTCQ